MFSWVTCPRCGQEMTDHELAQHGPAPCAWHCAYNDIMLDVQGRWSAGLTSVDLRFRMVLEKAGVSFKRAPLWVRKPTTSYGWSRGSKTPLVETHDELWVEPWIKAVVEAKLRAPIRLAALRRCVTDPEACLAVQAVLDAGAFCEFEKNYLKHLGVQS